jgi:hypothetical protein
MTADESPLATRLQEAFPPGILLPRGIEVLCEYLDAHGYPISGCFEIDAVHGVAEVEHWFRPEARGRVAVFGRGADGTAYALWLCGGRNPVNAPVVMLGSEGDVAVLAATPLAFCSLLGCGYDELGVDPFGEPPGSQEETAPLREWLKDNLGLDCPNSGEEIVAAAPEGLPDFHAWVGEHRA